MLEHERARLLAMAPGALLVQPGHRQTAGRLHDVQAVGIVALHAIHLALKHRVMLRQVELRMDIEVALQATGRILARVVNEGPGACGDMPAGGAMARFTAIDAGELNVIPAEFAVGAGGKNSRNVGVAIEAVFVPNKMSAFDFWRSDHGALKRTA